MKDIDPTRNKRQVLYIGVSVALRLSSLRELAASTKMEMVSVVRSLVERLVERKIVMKVKPSNESKGFGFFRWKCRRVEIQFMVIVSVPSE